MIPRTRAAPRVFASNQEAADALLRAAKDGSLEKALLKEPEGQAANVGEVHPQNWGEHGDRFG